MRAYDAAGVGRCGRRAGLVLDRCSSASARTVASRRSGASGDEEESLREGSREGSREGGRESIHEGGTVMKEEGVGTRAMLASTYSSMLRTAVLNIEDRARTSRRAMLVASTSHSHSHAPRSTRRLEDMLMVLRPLPALTTALLLA